MADLSPETERKVLHIRALRNEADHLAREVLRTGERGTVTALMGAFNIASSTVWNRYGGSIPRPRRRPAPPPGTDRFDGSIPRPRTTVETEPA